MTPSGTNREESVRHIKTGFKKWSSTYQLTIWALVPYFKCLSRVCTQNFTCFSRSFTRQSPTVLSSFCSSVQPQCSVFEAAAVPGSTHWSILSLPACRCPLTAGRKPRTLTYHSWKKLDRKFWMIFTELSQDSTRWDNMLAESKYAVVLKLKGVEVFQTKISWIRFIIILSNNDLLCHRKKHRHQFKKSKLHIKKTAALERGLKTSSLALQCSVGTDLSGMGTLWWWSPCPLPPAG